MGVTYKLKDEVVHFIISQRQENPLLSCRQLAESASEKFGVHLSKSSVHDVLKASGVVTPRGRKPKDKFEIPQEKKKQIQKSLSQVKLLAPPGIDEPKDSSVSPQNDEALTTQNNAPVILSEVSHAEHADPVPDTHNSSQVVPKNDTTVIVEKDVSENSSEYEGAGKIFLKAALWDLGIYSEENIKESDWAYYLTYSKGIKVVLENNKSFFIDLILPLERCIRETVDGLINNIKPFSAGKVSDLDLFKASMEAQQGFKITKITIVDYKNNNLFEYDHIVELKRKFEYENRVFVENYDKSPAKRSIAVFFSQNIDTDCFINNILNLIGFDTTTKQDLVVNLLPGSQFIDHAKLVEASEKLNGMNLYDEQERRVRIKIF